MVTPNIAAELTSDASVEKITERHADFLASSCETYAPTSTSSFLLVYNISPCLLVVHGV